LSKWPRVPSDAAGPSAVKRGTAPGLLAELGHRRSWDEGKIKPHIDGSYPFTEAAAAHRRILQRQNIGKVLLRP
jgi:NADPH:quinone reductase-like Zn-dependent oxidoreductase